MWSATGWNKIKQVIRHQVDKKIYRVTTPSGAVCVTEDHSSIDYLGNKIKPTECKPYTTKLLTTPLIKETPFKISLDKLLNDIFSTSTFD